MNKAAATLLAGLMALSMTVSAAVSAQAADFPKGNINVLVPFGAGGGTDNLARPISANVEKDLGVSLIINNVKGASGATGAQQIAESAADGYNLLFSAENVCIYDAMGISELTYQDFDPLMVFGSETVCMIVNSSSPFETITDLIEYAKANPGTVTKPVAGAAGLAAIADSLIFAATGAQMVQVPSDSDADGLIQLLGGEVTCAIGKLSTISSYLESGDVRPLCVFATERLEVLPDVPAITEEYPDFADYLPWGSFYALFAPKGTPDDVKAILIESFKTAAESEDVQELFANSAIDYLGLTGDDAVEYLNNYRKGVCTALITAGTSKLTAEELNLK